MNPRAGEDETSRNLESQLLQIWLNVNFPEPLVSTALGGRNRGRWCETSAFAAHVSTTMIQPRLYDDWKYTIEQLNYSSSRTSISEYKYSHSSQGECNTLAPVVRVACSDAQNVSSSEQTVLFPVVPETACRNSVQELDVAQLHNQSSDRIRTAWITLPADFGTTTTGLLLECPWTTEKTSRLAVGCSIDARWTDAT
jgi:hypothetical protein